MKHRCTFEHVLYALAFFSALALRLTNLGALPLSEYEARWAIPALNLAHEKAVELASQPFYELWTGLLFFLFAHSDFFARLIPAVMGSLLVLLPFLLRRSLGTKGALVASFGLAFDPGLTAASHYAGSPITALSATALAIGLWYDNRRGAAVCLGVLAALSGSAFFFGIVVLLAGLAVGRLLGLWNREDLSGFYNSDPAGNNRPSDGTVFLLIAGITVLAGGTMFFRHPQGLAAFVRSFPEFLKDWILPSGVPWLNMVWMLVFFQPLALLLGIMGFIRSWITKNRLDQLLGILVIDAWVLSIVHLGRQNLDLIWVLTPLWLLAGRELVRFWDAEREEILPILGHTALLFVLFSLGWLNMAGLINPQASPEVIRMRWILILGVLVLSLLATILISFGWSLRISQRGFLNGVVFCLALFVLSTTAGVVKVPRIDEGAPHLLYPPLAQWSPGPITGQSSLVTDTIGDYAKWHTGNPNIVDVVVVTNDPICDTCLPAAALQWALRDVSQVRVVEALATGETPTFVITPHEESELKLAEAYRGQSFAWQIQSAWRSGVPIGWMRWLLSRQVTAETVNIILWARSDVFPGGKQIDAQAGSNADQIEPPPGDLLPNEGDQ